MNIDVFISHHTSSSLHITEAICNSLESNGIKCWYAPRDTVGDYASSIVDAIYSCRVFVLVLNKESSYSEDVLNEINLAVDRMRASEDISILPFHISKDEISGKAKYYLGRMHWIDAIDPPMMDRIKELTNKVQTYLGKVPIPITNNTSTPTIQSNIVLPSKNFIGRTKELESIKEELTNYGKVFIRGIGGIGKSEIAKMFCKTYRGDYNNIIFANYQTNLLDMIISEKEVPISNFTRVTNDEGVIESDLDFFKRKLDMLKNLSNNKTLIIVDNFDTDNDPYLEEFLEGNYQVIFTTRNDFDYLEYPTINIEQLNIEESIELFKYNYKLRIDDIEGLTNIIKKVEGHTLAIILIAKFMQNNRLKPSDMLDMLNNNIKDLSGNIKYSFNNGTIYDYIKNLFNMSKLTKEEVNIMINLSIFPNDGIELTKFAKLSEIEDYSVIDNLINKSFILHDWYTDNISLHPLIKEVVINECNVTLDKCSTMLKNIANTIKKGWNGDKELELKYGEICKNILNMFPDINPKYIDEYCTFKVQLTELGYFDIADKINNDLIEINKQEYGEYSKGVARAYHDTAEDYLRKFDYLKASEYYKKSIEIIKKVDNEDLYKAYLIKAYSLLLLKMEKSNDAIKYLEESLDIYLKNEEKERRQLGSTYYALGKAYYQLKDYDKALELSNLAYEILVSISGENSYDASSPMHVLALINSKLGNYDKALELINKVIDMRLGFYANENHVNILTVYESKAEIYHDMEDYSMELEVLEDLKSKLELVVDKDNEWYKKITNKIKKIKEAN